MFLHIEFRVIEMQSIIVHREVNDIKVKPSFLVYKLKENNNKRSTLKVYCRTINFHFISLYLDNQLLPPQNS